MITLINRKLAGWFFFSCLIIKKKYIFSNDKTFLYFVSYHSNNFGKQKLTKNEGYKFASSLKLRNSSNYLNVEPRYLWQTLNAIEPK